MKSQRKQVENRLNFQLIEDPSDIDMNNYDEKYILLFFNDQLFNHFLELKLQSNEKQKESLQFVSCFLLLQEITNTTFNIDNDDDTEKSSTGS